MNRDFHFIITEKECGKTVSDILHLHCFSHSTIVHLKKTPESILKNGIWCYVNETVMTGDLIDIHLEETEGSPGIIPVRQKLSIIFEDEDLLILNKPADTPVHPSYRNYDNTLANGVLFYYTEQQIPYTFRCINRLDRDTTGLTIIAKNMHAAGILSMQMQKREIEKEYIAICEGIVPDHGKISAPIARAKESVIERCVDFSCGDPAVTDYVCLTSCPELSVIRVHPETGRTHQIRVHMKYIGHPLIGDFLYNPDSITDMPRQALHCFRLSFRHPVSRKIMTFRAPVPQDMKDILVQYHLTKALKGNRQEEII